MLSTFSLFSFETLLQEFLILAFHFPIQLFFSMILFKWFLQLLKIIYQENFQ